MSQATMSDTDRQPLRAAFASGVGPYGATLNVDVADVDIAIPSSPGSVGVSRSLKKAREAYSERDVVASAAAHQAIAVSPAVDGDATAAAVGTAKEKHSNSGEYIKSAIYGGLDGLMEMFVVIAGVSGGSLDPRVPIILGFASLIADALSMSVGDFMSTRAELEFAAAERKREMWECENFLEGEKQEMIELYESKGIKPADAARIVDILSKDKTVFVDFMMIDELNIAPEDESVSAWKNALVTFIAFIISGGVPLLAYVIAYFALPAGSNPMIAFGIVIACTAVALFVLGAVKARFTDQNPLISGLLTLVAGGTAAGASYGIGVLVNYLAPSA